MSEFAYPTAEALRTIAEEKMAVLVQDDPLLKEGGAFPVGSLDSPYLSWEQRDNFTGLQQLRGYDGAPARVAHVGSRRYTEQPGIYGEYSVIDEQELTERRKLGTFNEPIDISDLVMVKQDLLLQRRLDRQRYILWKLLTTGTFAIAQPNGGIIHTGSYTVQSLVGSQWSSAGSGTPLADLRAAKLKARGYSTSFGAQSVAYMNQTTANYLMGNTNSNDLGGKRLAVGATLNNLADFNRIFLDNELPQVQIYDQGYYTEGSATPATPATDWNLFIPTGKIVILGVRPGNQPVGEYMMTRNANNMDMGPGAYQRVFDRGETNVPRVIEVHDGHNGGPVLYFPSSVLVITVT
jgi:hypothetical protein